MLDRSVFTAARLLRGPRVGLTANATFSEMNLFDRACDAFRRRARRWLRRWQRRPAAPISAAAAALFARPDFAPRWCGDDDGDVPTTVVAVEAARALGLKQTAEAYARWLASHAATVAVDEAQLRPKDLHSSDAVHLARAAATAYRLAVGSRQQRAELVVAADRAMQRLTAHQTSGGAFPARLSLVSRFKPARQPLAAVAWYLMAAALQVSLRFEATVTDFDDTIDPGDGRARAVLDWLARLPNGSHVLDAGCGRGRFLRLALERTIGLCFSGLDVAEAMLEHVPVGVARLHGSLLEIPTADAAFDAVLAVESLEHALLPSHGLQEIARVLRPGGWLLVIDKHRAKQDLSHHDPWEEWFTPDELRHALDDAFTAIDIRPIEHSEGQPGSDLFFAASARRR